MFHLTEQLLSWLQNIVEAVGYPGIAFAIFLENIFPPIPSEVIMAGAGLNIAKGNLNFVLVVLFATVGAVLSAIVFYALGYYGGRPLIEKYGKYLRITQKDLDYTDTWFKKYGINVVFFGRFIPIVRTLVSFPAGIARENFVSFLLFTTLGSAIWLAFLTALGVIFGETVYSILGYMKQFETITLVGLIIACIVVSYVFYQKKFKSKTSATEK